MPLMAKRGAAKRNKPNRSGETRALLLGAFALFLASGFLPGTGAVGDFLREAFYGALGLPAYLTPLGLLALAYLVYRGRPLKGFLRHLLFAYLVAFALLPLLGEALGGRLGAGMRAGLEAWLGWPGLALPLLAALALVDLWRGRPPWDLLRRGLVLGVGLVRRARLGLRRLALRRRLGLLARLYPEHTALKALAQSLAPEELSKVEEALRDFVRERVEEYARRMREDQRPLEPRVQALLQALKAPVPGEGPLRDALEERRAALLLEASALAARIAALSALPALSPTLSGLLRARRLREERRARWEEVAGLLEDLEARFDELSRWLAFLEANPQRQQEGLRALLTQSPPPAPAQAPEPEPEAFDLDLVFPEPERPPPPPAPAPPPPPPPAPGLLALPTPDLLDPPEPKERSRASEEEAERLKRTIAETLRHFGVQAEVVGHARGPSVTRYEILPAPGEKISRIQSLQNDLARALAVGAVRIEAPIPGKNTVGLEVPNPKRELVRLSEAVLSPAFQNAKALLPLVLGKSIEGEIWVKDLAKMPHLLIAGSTGSGKSVAINVLLHSLLFKHLPTTLRLLLIDPKMVELTPYEGIPHLIRPVVTSPEEAAGVLQGAVAHMERRYRLMSQVGARNLEQYNAKVGPEEALPYLVIVVDELADLMMTAPKEVEAAILRLAQMARATGMHLILATQRPSVDILTSLIKVNIPARLAFAVSSGFDSRTILDAQGAERLIGQGDALFHQPGLPKPVRLQVPYVSEEEVARVAGFLRGQSYEDRFAEAYGADFEPPKAVEGGGPGEVDFSDPLLKKAAEIVVEEGYGSVSRLQRRLSIGHARAGKLMDALEAMGIVGPPRGSKPREVLVTKDQLKDFFG